MRMTERQKVVSINVIEAFLVLDDQQQAEFDALLATPEGKEVRDMITVYEQRGIEKGIEQGVVLGKRETLLRLMRQKFGELRGKVQKDVEAISDTRELDKLLDRLMTATNLDGMGLDNR